jgi:hypothetical protein
MFYKYLKNWRKHMVHLKPNKGIVTDLTGFDVTISSKEKGFVNITKVVVIVSVLLAILMITIK